MKEKHIIGWREWVKLPELNIKNIKAKLDTGARTSSLHAYDIETFRRRGREFVRFRVHPLQRNTEKTVKAEAEIIEFRHIRSSTGHESLRPVILTELEILGESWPIEVTLANRDQMGFRMLIGREGVRGRAIVDPGKSYYSGKPKFKKKKSKAKAKKNDKKTTKILRRGGSSK